MTAVHTRRSWSAPALVRAAIVLACAWWVWLPGPVRGEVTTAADRAIGATQPATGTPVPRMAGERTAVHERAAAPRPRSMFAAALAANLILTVIVLTGYQRHLRHTRDNLLAATASAMALEQQLRQGLESLGEAQETFWRLTDATQGAIIVTDGEGRVTYWNTTAERLFGYSAAEALGSVIHDRLAPRKPRPDAMADGTHFFSHEDGPSGDRSQEIEALHRDGRRIPVEISVASIAHDGRWGAISILRDCSARRLAQNQMQRMQSSFSNVVLKNHSGILVVDRQGLIRFSNPAAQKSLGRNAAQLDGLPFGLPSIGSQTELDILRPDGSYGVAEVTATETEWEGCPASLIMLHDITDRKRAEDQVQHQATHDPLTGLPNRILFLNCLEQALLDGRRHHQPLAVLFLDLDRFKEVNDTLGHRVGDALLEAVAVRLKRILCNNDLVARLGGDEFTVLARRVGSASGAGELAARISTAFSTPLDAAGHRLYSRPSIGIALFPAHGNTAETLMRNADTAMYEAKRRPGIEGFAFYQPEQTQRSRERLDLETRLRNILAAGGLRLRYQAQADLRTGRLCAAETLLRCVDAQGRILLPGQFIPVMEQTGLIREAGDWALGAACMQIRAWLDQQSTHADTPACTPPPLAINLSAVQLDDATLPDRIAELLDRYRLDPARLALEVTETALMDKADRARTILERLTTLGVSLHLDDFGTGYSSLALLGELPFSVIKIDRSFVRQVPGSEKHVGLIAAMIAMAHRLHLRVVAEGVETPEQWALLRQLGCDMAQGYLISRPLPPAAFARICMGHRDIPVKHG